MPRRYQAGLGGHLFHVLNRAGRRATLFSSREEFEAFEWVLAEACRRYSMRLLCYVVMPNHWHLVVWPRKDCDLSGFMKWLTQTHAQRWHLAHHSSGTGALYQGRFKAFPIQQDGHFLIVCRYVERNPLRAGLVKRAADWRWGSAALANVAPPSGVATSARPMLHPWPVSRPRDWANLVDAIGRNPGAPRVRASVRRNSPFGRPEWQSMVAAELRWSAGIRPAGRPRSRVSAQSTTAD